ncbi:MAG: glycosyltransferase family protein [Alphaproteobacteria bacterium]
MPPARSHRRILIYSHDTFGLGHLRRCRDIAHNIVAARKDMSVMIISGSPIIGSFDFRARVDFVRVPGVIKLRNGEYTSLNELIDIEETLSMRSSLIDHMAAMYAPDVVIVDKEPTGLRGEMGPALARLKAEGALLVLGLRDVLDDPEKLSAEWERKGALKALEMYDRLWVYGRPEICDPLAGLDVPAHIRDRMAWTGYLERDVPDNLPADYDSPEQPYLLVTTGGGGDGADLVDWVLSAYEMAEQELPWRAHMVLGPFMPPEARAGFQSRAEKLSRVQAVTFEPRMEPLMANASGIVAMGGYNTFCEILSFDRPALIVPRTAPRLEQTIRATRACEKGLIGMLDDRKGRDPARMVSALKALPNQQRPSAAALPDMMAGHQTILAELEHRFGPAP